MRRRMSPAQRRWLRKHPAPPGPEPGKTFYHMEDEWGVKHPATPEEVQQAHKEVMDAYDKLSPKVRKLVNESRDGRLPEGVTVNERGDVVLTKDQVCKRIGISPLRARVSPMPDGTYRVYNNGRFHCVYKPGDDE